MESPNYTCRVAAPLFSVVFMESLNTYLTLYLFIISGGFGDFEGI